MAEHLNIGARAIGLAAVAVDGEILDTWFPSVSLCDEGEVSEGKTVFLSDSELASAWGDRGRGVLVDDRRRQVKVLPVETTIASLHDTPASISDIYLRLHMLSMRLIMPGTANLQGIFDFLPLMAWTSFGPCRARDADILLWHARREGLDLTIKGTFIVPSMLDYVVPKGVAIPNAAHVQLGAYLAPGTFLTPAGFCALDCGTLGQSFIEGRISVGVVVDEGTHVGGGASIMGSTAGGGKRKITIGKRCLLGANSGVGISLGDGCVVEAGCYITAGTLVRLNSGEIKKASELSGQDNVLFRRHSITGQVEALEGKAPAVKLNPSLHLFASDALHR
jgi:2,3,4,5-tetrahydropyridine-2,6-dicarboxylate N-succinyltransferase